jgi:uncharacterized protein (DUF58 family)
MQKPETRMNPGAANANSTQRFFYRGASFALRANRRLEARTTAAGRGLAMLAMIAAAVGIDTSLTLAYQVFSLALAALAVAWVASLRAPRGVQLAVAAPRQASAGLAFDCRVNVANRGAAALRDLDLRLEFADAQPSLDEFTRGARSERRNRYDRWLGYYRFMELAAKKRNARAGEVSLADAAPGSTLSLRVPVTPLGRGVIRIAGATVMQREPLGLLRAPARAASPAKVIVLPRRYRVPRIAFPGARRYQHGGVALAGRVGESEEFVALREYRAGDPLHRMHWASSARLGRLVIKEYQDEFFERHALVLDTFVPGGAEQAFEEAVSIAASFACTLDTQESLLDLLFVEARAHSFTAGHGLLGAGQLLELLAAVQPASMPDFGVLAHAVLEQRAALSSCLLVLIAWDDARRGLAERLVASGLPIVALVVSKDKPAAAPAWLKHIDPERVEEGLARL